jgi:hypothetical protein
MITNIGESKHRYQINVGMLKTVVIKREEKGREKEKRENI